MKNEGTLKEIFADGKVLGTPHRPSQSTTLLAQRPPTDSTPSDGLVLYRTIK